LSCFFFQVLKSKIKKTLKKYLFVYKEEKITTKYDDGWSTRRRRRRGQQMTHLWLPLLLSI
jgi:hypothetical protein